MQDGEFQGWFKGTKALINQGNNQAVAAKGAPIEWHMADEEAVQVLQKLFLDNKIKGIKIIYAPASQ